VIASGGKAEFDLCGPLPRGVTLLEASAGTGKTFAIAGLVALTWALPAMPAAVAVLTVCAILFGHAALPRLPASDPHRRAPRLVVVSATDVARALRAHLRLVGYDAVIVEPRAERLVASDEPHVEAIDELELGTSDVVVLTDHDAPYAATVLAAAARSPARFVGMMSSRRHVVRHLDALRALGLSDEEVARVHAPVGLDIGGRSADEIALSIAAGIVADDHGRGGGWMDR